NTNTPQGGTVAAINELIQLEMVVAVIGPLSQSASTVAAKKAQEQGVPIITFSQRPDITKGSEWVFRNYLTPDKEVEALVKKAIGDMGMLRFGIFYPDSSYGSHLMTVFWDTVEEMGGEITASESYKPGDTDFSEGIKKLAGLYYPRPKSVVDALVAQRLRDLGFAGPETMETQGRAPDPEDQQADSAAVEDALGTMDIEVQGPDGIPDRIITSARRSQFINPDTGEPDMALIEHYARTDPIIDFDAVFIPDNSRNIALIAPQFPFYNVFNVPFLGTSLWLSDELVKTTSDYMQGAIFPVGFYADNESPGIMDFVSLYREAYGKEPGLLAATGFDTIKMIKGLLTENDILTRADFRDALLGYENYSGVTGQISFDEEGEVEKMPTLLTIHGKGYHILK
ncbi:MAG: ABC transporter substrate-binding protein, partial [Deltaproteobacteria bacterium]|nr:ABC transporter substrate-binding protein [Deltaproteobacteria bacterium]